MSTPTNEELAERINRGLGITTTLAFRRDGLEALVELAARLRRAERLVKYAGCMNVCATVNGSGGDCDCGYVEAQMAYELRKEQVAGDTPNRKQVRDERDALRTRLAEVERERNANAVALAATVTRADRAERERDEARACENSQNEDACGACLVCAEVGRDHALRQRAEALARAEAAEEALVNQKAFVVEFARRVEQVWKEQEVARETAERDLDRERDARRRATMLLGEIVTQRDAWRKRAEVAETKLARLCDCDAGVPEKPHDPECAALAPAPEPAPGEIR